jgi:hypothetical protein
MAIANFPSNLADIIQLGYLEREFKEALEPILGYRDVSTREPFLVQVGESITKSRASLMPIGSLSPINPTSNTPLDNGLTIPAVWSVEQYILPLNLYGNRTPDLNIIADKVAIQSQFLKNAKNLGIQASTELDMHVRNLLLDAYLGGNTRVRVALAVPSATIQVDDVRGFLKSFPTAFPVAGAVAFPDTTSPSATQDVLVGSTVYTLESTLPDVVNVSTAASVGGISGILTFSSNVSVADAGLASQVISTVGSHIVRPNGKTTTFQLSTADVFTMAEIQAAVAYLESNAVPKIDGYYNCYIDPYSKQEIFSDPNFLLLFRGTMFKSEEYRNLVLVEGLGVRFIQVNTAPIQSTFTTASSAVVNVHRPFICGDEVVIEGDFLGMDSYLEQANESNIGHVVDSKGIHMITRMPLDRQLTFISQSWLYVGGFVVPTDYLTNPQVIPTASNAYYKRGVFIEHV